MVILLVDSVCLYYSWLMVAIASLIVLEIQTVKSYHNIIEILEKE